MSSLKRHVLLINDSFRLFTLLMQHTHDAWRRHTACCPYTFQTAYPVPPDPLNVADEAVDSYVQAIAASIDDDSGPSYNLGALLYNYQVVGPDDGPEF